MELNPIIVSPLAQKPLPLTNPTVQAAIAPAVVSQQQAASLTRTQTTQATTATGRAESSHATQNGTRTAQAVDARANAAAVATNGGAADTTRGGRLNLVV